jgi:hypothetical protein
MFSCYSSKRILGIVSLKCRLYLSSFRVDMQFIWPAYRYRGPGFDSQRYQIFWEVVGLKRGPPSLVRIFEDLRESKVAAPV